MQQQISNKVMLKHPNTPKMHQCTTTNTTTIVYGPLDCVWDYLGEPVPER